MAVAPVGSGDAAEDDGPENVSEGAGAVNVAVTLCIEFIVMLQVPVPVQAPLHPENVLGEVGVAVSVTLVPLL